MRATGLTALVEVIREAACEHPIVAKAIVKYTDGSVRNALIGRYDICAN